MAKNSAIFPSGFSKFFQFTIFYEYHMTPLPLAIFSIWQKALQFLQFRFSHCNPNMTWNTHWHSYLVPPWTKTNRLTFSLRAWSCMALSCCDQQKLKAASHWSLVCGCGSMDGNCLIVILDRMVSEPRAEMRCLLGGTSFFISKYFPGTLSNSVIPDTR